jgi:hypothetical protein
MALSLSYSAFPLNPSSLLLGHDFVRTGTEHDQSCAYQTLDMSIVWRLQWFCCWYVQAQWEAALGAEQWVCKGMQLGCSQPHERNLACRGTAVLQHPSFYSVLAVVKRVRKKKKSLLFLAFGYNHTLISALKCHTALWLLSEGDAVRSDTHADSQQLQRTWTGPKSEHMCLFMGKREFPKFWLYNLTFNNTVLCRNKNIICRNRTLA